MKAVLCHVGGQSFYATAFGDVPLYCPLWFRASRLSSRFGRNFNAYLDGWMEFQFKAGKLENHPDLQSPTTPAHVRARRTEVQIPTLSAIIRP